MADQQVSKVKGVVDMVFLIDATGSMSPCIDALKENIGLFIDFLTGTKRAGNDISPVKDWRAKVFGFRDVEADGEAAFVDNPFVADAAALKAQLAALNADGGGDEPESLLDALYRVANMGQSDKGATADPGHWRYRSAAARVVIAFTDASYKERMSIAEATGGTFDAVNNALVSNRIILSLFAPEMECHNRLSAIDKAEYIAIPNDSDGPQAALRKFTADLNNFRETLKQLAASVSKSSETLTA